MLKMKIYYIFKFAVLKNINKHYIKTNKFLKSLKKIKYNN